MKVEEISELVVSQGKEKLEKELNRLYMILYLIQLLSSWTSMTIKPAWRSIFLNFSDHRSFADELILDLQGSVINKCSAEGAIRSTEARNGILGPADISKQD